MERRYSKGENICYTLIEKNYYRDYGSRAYTPHPKEIKICATFIEYVGERSARILIHRTDGRESVEKTVPIRNISPKIAVISS